VGAVSVVTRFGMLSFLPLIPRESSYAVRQETKSAWGVPLFLSVREVSVVGLPLARLDYLSVAAAYVRGLFAALALVGSLTLVPGYMWLLGSHMDAFAVMLTKVTAACFVIGVIGGLATYAFAWSDSRRQNQIRTSCGVVLGLAVDPARLRPEVALRVLDFAERAEPDEGSENRSFEIVRRLTTVRARIGAGESHHALKLETDDLLERFRTMEPSAC
jgi:hypothetical protein